MKNIVSISLIVVFFSAFGLLASCEQEDLDSQVTVENPQGNGGNEFDCVEYQANIGDTCESEGLSGVLDVECFCDTGTSSEPDCPDFYIDGWSDGNYGSPCETPAVPQGGIIGENCGCVEGEIVYDCPDLQANFGYDCITEGGQIGFVNASCNCEPNVGFECPDFQGNSGDDCTDPMGNVGVISDDCECITNSIEFDCPGLGGNIGDPCQGGWGTVSADCDCEENQPQTCSIEGKWLLANAGGADLPPNTMYEFQDGIRYTYYCTDGESCDWSAMTIADAIPGTNDYVFINNVLTVDLNFGNESVNEVIFDCDCNVIDLQYPGSTWTWWRIGVDPNDCN